MNKNQKEAGLFLVNGYCINPTLMQALRKKEHAAVFDALAGDFSADTGCGCDIKKVIDGFSASSSSLLDAHLVHALMLESLLDDMWIEADKHDEHSKHAINLSELAQACVVLIRVYIFG